MIDVVECGAGAGSIAWIDRGGHLKVGPKSAEAIPGPACYGKGGECPTVTDAHLILGRLSADHFLGGEMALYPRLSEVAINRHICVPLKMGLKEAAAGILAIANASMLRLLRLISVMRGHDPREFTLMAYGGAGPLHAADLAEKMSINHIIVPRLPGLFSTLGLLYGNRTTDFMETAIMSLNKIANLNRILSRLKKRAEAWYEKNDVAPKERKIQVSADLRYFHQNYELNISLPGPNLSKENIRLTKEGFHQVHAKTYGLSAPGEKIQVVNLRLQASILQPKPKIQRLGSKASFDKAKQAKMRSVWFKNGELRCHIYDRLMLAAGQRIKGPAIIQEKESTTLVSPYWYLQVDKFGNLHLKKHK